MERRTVTWAIVGAQQTAAQQTPCVASVSSAHIPHRSELPAFATHNLASERAADNKDNMAEEAKQPLHLDRQHSRPHSLFVRTEKEEKYDRQTRCARCFTFLLRWFCVALVACLGRSGCWCLHAQPVCLDLFHADLCLRFTCASALLLQWT